MLYFISLGPSSDDPVKAAPGTLAYGDSAGDGSHERADSDARRDAGCDPHRGRDAGDGGRHATHLAHQLLHQPARPA